MNDNSTSVETTRVNRLSDHEFLLALAYLNQQGQTEYGFPPYDWELKFYTSSTLNYYTVSCRGGVMLNCQREGDMVRIIMDGHKLSTGVLRARSTIYIPDSNFPDGTRRVVDEHEFKTLFVSGHGALASGPQLELLFPYVKGDPGKPFTYDDFTPEQLEGLRGPQGNPLTYDDLTPGQIAELQRPATEAAQLVSSAIDAATATNNAITKAEQSRVETEQQRGEAEALRVEAEALRVEAEQARAREFAGFAQAIDKGTIKCFIDKWDAAWKVNGVVYGKYDPANAPDPQHPFMANKLWLNYDEAIIVDSVSSSMSRVHVADMKARYRGGKGYRTLAPIIGIGDVSPSPDLYRCFESNQDIEVLVFRDFYPANIQYAFWGCSKMRVIDELAYAKGEDPFGRCYNLESVKLYYIRGNVSFADCPKLNLESLNYMIDYARNSDAITITLHPDAYARVTEEIFAAAAAKNITIATP